MANDSEDIFSSEHVFDFSSVDFAHVELISTLHAMDEYQKIAQSFEEAKAKQSAPKNETTETDWKQSVDMLTLKMKIA